MRSRRHRKNPQSENSGNFFIPFNSKSGNIATHSSLTRELFKILSDPIHLEISINYIFVKVLPLILCNYLNA